MVDDQGCSCTYHVNLILLTCVLCFVLISCTLYLLHHLPQLKHIETYHCNTSIGFTFSDSYWYHSVGTLDIFFINVKRITVDSRYFGFIFAFELATSLLCDGWLEWICKQQQSSCILPWYHSDQFKFTVSYLNFLAAKKSVFFLMFMSTLSYPDPGFCFIILPIDICMLILDSSSDNISLWTCQIIVFTQSKRTWNVLTIFIYFYSSTYTLKSTINQ